MTVHDTIRIGVVGTSAHADSMHLTNLVSHPRAEVVAVCGRNRDRAARLAQKHGIPHVFTDYRELIEKGELDALVVATPDDLHYPMTMDALDAGLHVLCEKPLALDGEQAREMFERAEEVGVKHMTFFSWRWLPAQRYLWYLIQEGFVGRCLHARLEFLHGFGRDRSYDWRYDWQRAHGVLGDLGSHLIDLARWYVGDIVRVSARLNMFVERAFADDTHPVPANDAAFLLLDFANGAEGTLTANAVAQVGNRNVEQRIAIYGDAGTLEANYSAFGTCVRGIRAGRDRPEELPIPRHLWEDADRRDPFVVFREQSVGDRLFVDAIVDGRPASPSFFDGLRAQQVVDAALEASRQGRWVELG